MATVVCVLHDDDRLLLTRESEGPSSGTLKLVGGRVQPGESALHACIREVEERTHLRIMPSCAGLFFTANPGHIGDYGLAFVVDISTLAAKSDPTLEWVALQDLDSRTDLDPVDRELIAPLLATDHPLAIVIAPKLEAEPGRMQIVAVSSIDGATLSPLVFAEMPEANRSDR